MTRFALLILVSALTLCGCSHLPQFATSIAWPNKDVLLIRVYLDAPLATHEYRAVARREAERHLGLPSPSEIPVYEIRCEFLTRSSEREPMRRLATVRLSPQDDAHAPVLVHSQTIVY